jgi:uncharacterized protein HemX
MYRVLWIVAVLAVAALGTSIITAVVEQSHSARQSSEINTLDHKEASDHQQIDDLSRELHAVQQSSHLAHPQARKGSASVLSATSIRRNPAIGPAALPYSGLTWRHALLLN